jgi:hypothetical protein
MKRTIEVLSDDDLLSQIIEGRKKDVKILDFEEFTKKLRI